MIETPSGGRARIIKSGNTYWRSIPTTLRERLLIVIIAFALSVFLTGCSDSKYYRVRFDRLDRLTIGDIVYVDSVYAGKVSDLQIEGNHKILATVNIGPSYMLTKGSTFTVSTELLGIRRIDIEPGESKELIDPEEIQIGITAPGEVEVISTSTYDSLLRHDQKYRLIDTLGKLVDAIRKDTNQKENGN